MDPRYPRSPAPRCARRARATTARTRRARRRSCILQGGGISPRVARASPGSCQPTKIHFSSLPRRSRTFLDCLQLLSLGASAGALHPLCGGSDSVTGPTLSDRFQLGGPTNLRMFRANSLGPRDGGALILSSSPHSLAFTDMVSI